MNDLAASMSSLRISMPSSAYEQNEMPTPRVEPTTYEVAQRQVDDDKFTGNYRKVYHPLFHHPMIDRLRAVRGADNCTEGWRRPDLRLLRNPQYPHSGSDWVPLDRAGRVALYESEDPSNPQPWRKIKTPEKERRRIEEELKGWRLERSFKTGTSHDLYKWEEVVESWKDIPEVLAIVEEFKAVLEGHNAVHKNKRRSFWVRVKLVPYGEWKHAPAKTEMEVICDWRVHHDHATFSPLHIKRSVTLPPPC